MSVAPEHADRFAERGEMTREDVIVLAERTARQLLGVSMEDAFSMLDNGELDGTAAESSLRAIRHLISSE